MSFKTSKDLRQSFLDYFAAHGHQVVRSSPLIPLHDPSLLFTNAGMNQFKDFFTGAVPAPYPTAATAQKCVRAGGKHNDLESVGRTKRHHTFFEMLGNFSFGDYFKKEAMEYAWEFLTKNIGLDETKLWVSVFREDNEAFDLWTKHMKVPASRVVRMDEDENFWQMGDTGPCGPCSEIYIDRGEAFGNESIFDGGERFLEIWNLVFMQYERFEGGALKPLPKPSVDTGMGLERLASVVQNVDNNYLTDAMLSILMGFSELLSQPFGKKDEIDLALKVLTDHIRACSFLIADGVQPANEGRGYVLRRILRRAIRFGRNLGQTQPFFYKGVALVVNEMAEAYPELRNNQAAIEKIIEFEEQRFFETLDSGLNLLESEIKNLGVRKTLEGATAFKLYDTYGFPLDLTQMILEEKGLSVDQVGFEQALEQQRERSRASWKGQSKDVLTKIGAQVAELKSEFTGYTSIKEEAKVIALFDEKGEKVETLKQDEKGSLLTERTPFYAESGGQIGDAGKIVGAHSVFDVEDCQKVQGLHLHIGCLKSGNLSVGEMLRVEVDGERRRQTRIHHTMTHVMHAALQEILGDHIKQAGSLVAPHYLRFDFTHFQAVTSEELSRIEEYCNDRIRENPELKLSEESYDDAIAGGAKAFFDDKYGDKVRVLKIGKFSTELCGGTHAESLAEAGIFKITRESSVAAGIRRIEAVTAKAAYHYIRQEERLLDEVAAKLRSPRFEVLSRVEKLLADQKELSKKLQNKGSADQKKATDLVQEIENIKLVVDLPSVESAKELRPIADDFKNQIKSGVVILGASLEGKATVVISVTKDIAEHFNTRDLVTKMGELLDGKGGGRPDFAQVGGQNIQALSKEKLLAITAEHIKSLRLSA